MRLLENREQAGFPLFAIEAKNQASKRNSKQERVCLVFLIASAFVMKDIYSGNMHVIVRLVGEEMTQGIGSIVPPIERPSPPTYLTIPYLPYCSTIPYHTYHTVPPCYTIPYPTYQLRASLPSHLPHEYSHLISTIPTNQLLSNQPTCGHTSMPIQHTTIFSVPWLYFPVLDTASSTMLLVTPKVLGTYHGVIRIVGDSASSSDCVYWRMQHI